MAIYDKGRNFLNDMERESSVVVKTIDGSEGYESGDVLFLGMIPRECIATDIRIIANPALDATFDLGIVSDFPEPTIVPIATDVVTVDNKTTVIPMPVNGIIDAAGVDYTGDKGSIWSGPNGINLGVKLNGAVTKGLLHIIVTYSYYGTKDGKYGAATIPMKPYKR